MKIAAWRTATVLLSVALGHASLAQQPVLQRGNDLGVSGANLSETTLTTSNVGPSSFGLLSTLPVDAFVYAQPLYVPKVAVAGQGIHNVLYVASMNDSLYAFDADSGAQLWSVNLAASVGAAAAQIQNFTFSGNQNLYGSVGILSTPVIDASTNLMYVVAGTVESNTLVWRLHAVDITSGREPLANVVVSGTYAGLTFDGRYQTQRASLTLAANQVVFAFGAVEAEYSGGYAGWVMAYDKQTLAQTGTFATIASGTKGGGVWQSGRPPAVDGAGYVYLFTGNGFSNGYNGTNAFGESVLKLDPAHGLALVDWFTPSNWSALDSLDQDLSSSGPMLVPNTSLLAGGGKAGTFYLLNTANLGHNSATDSGALQSFSMAPQFRGGTVYWQRSAANGGPLLYHWGSGAVTKAYAFNGSTFATTPASQGGVTPVYPGGILSLSANGDTPGTGILWGTWAPSGSLYHDPTDPGVLYAMDAGNVANVLWSSTMNSARDALGNFAKFVPPTIANGKVYVATFSNRIDVYGLLGAPPPTAAAPSFSPAPGAYTGTQQVALADATPGAVIHYTTDGTAPTSASPTYAGGATIVVSATSTLQAIAIASGYANSAVSGGTYTISAPVSAVNVSLSGTANVVGMGRSGVAVPGGGLDGGGWAYASELLGSSISWSGATFKLGAADAVDAVSNKTVALPAGNYSSLKLLATAVNGNFVNQPFVVTYTDGTTTTITQSLSNWSHPQSYAGETIVSTMAYRVTSTGAQNAQTFYLYGYSLTLDASKTVKSVTLPPTRNVIVLAMDLTPVAGVPAAATPTFSPAPGTYTGPQQVTLTDTTPGAVIHYTLNGTTPTSASPTYTSGIPLAVSATETVAAIAVASGFSSSVVAAGTYTISGPAAPVSVDLSSAANVVGLGQSGTPVGSGGLDGAGYAYASDLLGTSLSWSGASFTLGAVATLDAVANATIVLPGGKYTSAKLLATGANGSHPSQKFVVTYTDGTTTTVVQNVSDWHNPQSYNGETIVSTMDYRITSTGAQDARTFYLYGYSLAINKAKTVQSITLPAYRYTVVLAISLVP